MQAVGSVGILSMHVPSFIEYIQAAAELNLEKY